uniref:Sodium/calcium exchanger membrane region domain-containing protein n=1 Tax=Setaria digitata TaxID=48799 RepID=A0A915PFK8_9BILA
MNRLCIHGRLPASSFQSFCIMLILFTIFPTVLYIYATDQMLKMKEPQTVDKYSPHLIMKTGNENLNKNMRLQTNGSTNSSKSSSELLVQKNLPVVHVPNFRRLLSMTSADRCPRSPASPTDSSSSLFPKDYFTLEQRRHGALLLHFFGLIYMFIAISIVSDEFFVPSLSVITEKLSISDDVAGATFMAAGGSAPEFFASLFGVFITQNNVGIGTIVGSATFNILCVLAFCTFFSHEILKITWWPMLRDISFYVFALFLLVIFFLDEAIEWYEAMSLFITYIIYGIVMEHNEQLEKNFKLKLHKISQHLCPSFINNMPMEEAVPTPSIITVKHIKSVPVQNSATVARISGSGEASNESAKIVTSGNQLEIAAQKNFQNNKSNIIPEVELPGSIGKLNDEANCKITQRAPKSVEMFEERVVLEKRTNESETPVDISWPSSTRARLSYLFLAPIMIPLYYTLPDSKNASSRKYFVITFVGSILWIALFSYLMVWWASIIGETLAIPDEIMGLTVLAAGTSIPDLVSSVIVARKGLGDMAVSSSIGSNLFDICVGLPIPWLLQFAIRWLTSARSTTSSLGTISVISKGLICSVGLLFLMLIVLIVAIRISGWKMNKVFGIVMLVAYLTFCLLSVLLELGYVVCPLVVTCK